MCFSMGARVVILGLIGSCLKLFQWMIIFTVLNEDVLRVLRCLLSSGGVCNRKSLLTRLKRVDLSCLQSIYNPNIGCFTGAIFEGHPS